MSIEAPIAKAPQRARGVQRVAELLDAGAALFAENGYETTTMTQIAQRAGASIGSLYQFFPSKEALAEALFVRYVERVASMLEDLAKRAPGLPPPRLADRLIDLMLKVRSDRDSAAALSGSVSGIVERRKSLRGATRRQIAAILRAASPRLREKAAAEAAAMIGHVLKLVPTLAKEQEDGGQPLVPQVRKMLAAYIECVVKR
ncbi:MAG TPA: TetR/AcrR family transcriptional regulator [Bradyrhizobium sp.]|jgi:AcrR family transcriptional regulator|uniref:TetR/AcrR family transcriptional regulator n=1 Tax=Bradyrhizobium sp. TaxID=376 RepID=UPI002C9F3B31|nr:TetR/AcrR family transcriptional regulator [Bradyrhizobium sp.]HTB01559.1 TetR/AcrR family transcriptional regulator [Bradyrhizobium sp.]